MFPLIIFLVALLGIAWAGHHTYRAWKSFTREALDKKVIETFAWEQVRAREAVPKENPWGQACVGDAVTVASPLGQAESIIYLAKKESPAPAEPAVPEPVPEPAPEPPPPYPIPDKLTSHPIWSEWAQQEVAKEAKTLSSRSGSKWKMGNPDVLYSTVRFSGEAVRAHASKAFFTGCVGQISGTHTLTDADTNWPSQSNQLPCNKAFVAVDVCFDVYLCNQVTGKTRAVPKSFSEDIGHHVTVTWNSGGSANSTHVLGPIGPRFLRTESRLTGGVVMPLQPNVMFVLLAFVDEAQVVLKSTEDLCITVYLIGYPLQAAF